jgi:hypothetical protein
MNEIADRKDVFARISGLHPADEGGVPETGWPIRSEPFGCPNAKADGYENDQILPAP